MPETNVHRRERIVLSAIDLIHEVGLHSVSTKEIARRQGISESTIFKHFPTKNDLFMAVLEQFALYDRDLFHTAQATKRPGEALAFYVEAYTAYYENYPAITALVYAYDVLRGIPELEDKAKSILLDRWEFMRQLIETAQDLGQICQEVSVETLADIFTATCNGMCAKWRMQEFSFSLREETLEAVNLLIAAFRPKNSVME